MYKRIYKKVSPRSEEDVVSSSLKEEVVMSIQVVEVDEISSKVLVGIMSLVVVVVMVAVLPLPPEPAPSPPSEEQYPPDTHVWPERQ